MSSAEIEVFDGFVEHRPFYFKSYDRIIGTARNIHDLWLQIERLAVENPAALEYHLKEGHIVRWLEDSNERELAEQLRGVEQVQEARQSVSDHYSARRRQFVRPHANTMRKRSR